MNEIPWQTKWSIEQIRAMLLEQFQVFWHQDTGIDRAQLTDLLNAKSTPHAVIISGLRRVGKSTLLAQLAHQLGEEKFYYLTFEDERLLGFQAQDANLIYQMLVELFGERHIFLLDEIQNVPGWEHFVRRFMDMGFKFYLTGSNASLLSKELGSKLTGRYISIELFPFSFQEFIHFKEYTLPPLERMTTLENARLQRYLQEYLELGGIPDPIKYPQLSLHRALYEDVLYRDIATRYQIEEVRALKELAFYLVSNPATLVSYNKLKEMLGLGSVNTVKSYIEYLENSWLIFTINVFAFSVKRQQIAPKKIYLIDTGLAKSVGFSFSANTGRLLENLVFLALRRKTRNLYYYTSSNGYEVDFYLPETRQLIQVTQNLVQPDIFERETRALLDSMDELNLSHSLILSDTGGDPIQVDGKTIEVRSIASYLI